MTTGWIVTIVMMVLLIVTTVAVLIYNRRHFERVMRGWTVDYQADAAYLQLSSAPVARTLRYGLVNLDLDADGNAIGIELLTLKARAKR